MAEERIKCPDYRFPEVFLRPPLCLIALSGLDVTNNAVHRQVWDEFSSGIRRADRRPILFKNFPANHLYPKCGPDVSCSEVKETNWSGPLLLAELSPQNSRNGRYNIILVKGLHDLEFINDSCTFMSEMISCREFNIYFSGHSSVARQSAALWESSNPSSW